MTAGLVSAGRAEPGDAGRVHQMSPGLLGLTALEAEIMELAWSGGGELSRGEIQAHLDRQRPAARSTVEAVVGALVRKGHLERSSRDGSWHYRAARSLPGYLAGLIGALVAASPDPAATLALAGITDEKASSPAGVRLVVCYDGCWYQHAARFFARQRGTALSVAGLHDAIRWHAAGLYGCPVQRVTISQAHYVRGLDESSAWFGDELADYGVIRHGVPVTAGKGEVGGDVELALTCYQIVCETSPDMLVLMAGDGDFAPLAARLAGRGVRVLVPVADFSYPRPGDGAAVMVLTSHLLARRATDTPALAGLLEAAGGPDYPPFLIRPFPAPATAPRDGQPGRRSGVVTRWPPGASYGFITGEDGMRWFASALDTPGRTPLPPGCPVTFTGDPEPPAGRSCPPARAIMPVSKPDREAGGAAGPGGPGTADPPVPDSDEA